MAKIFIALVGLFFVACFKPPMLQSDAVGVKIYRGKSGIANCQYIGETAGKVHSNGYGLSLEDSIKYAEIDLKNKIANVGGNAAVIISSEQKLIDKKYHFMVGVGADAPSKLEDYLLYAEAYKCY